MTATHMRFSVVLCYPLISKYTALDSRHGFPSGWAHPLTVADGGHGSFEAQQEHTNHNEGSAPSDALLAPKTY